MNKIFKIGSVSGSRYDVIGPEGEHYRNVELWRDDLRDAEGGLTRVRVIITRDTAGRVDAAWQHEDPTCGKMPIANYDVGYQENIGFWASVKDHIQMLESGDIPGECLGLGYGWQECPDLPEFLNAEPDDMGPGLINMDTGERVSWGDLEQPDEILAAIARKAEESGKGGAE